MAKTKKKYKLIPFHDIDEEARDIAVAWVDNFPAKRIGGMEIEQKHKLASDIMGYAIGKRNKALVEELKQHKKKPNVVLHEKMKLALIHCYTILVASPVRFKDLEAEVHALINEDIMKIARTKLDRFNSAILDLQDFNLAHPDGCNTKEQTEKRKLQHNIKTAEGDYVNFLKSYKLE